MEEVSLKKGWSFNKRKWERSHFKGRERRGENNQVAVSQPWLESSGELVQSIKARP